MLQRRPHSGRRAWGWAGACLTADGAAPQQASGSVLAWLVGSGVGKGEEERRTGASLGGRAGGTARVLALAQPTMCACFNAAICNK